ncbi:hypothetical protein SAMN04489727_3933 [Amycolatopsis tolypomycina]|uniref:Uncharacterized protein n=1 Tax=Amycolatopsis tolypomycina TaxID=208445 RepID=A0A1H4SX52_9PSEU|nr:hypothetical protein SAMN04489727_3933 [Amycolatopsis tolypomycina]
MDRTAWTITRRTTPRTTRSAIICRVTSTRAPVAIGVMSPKPTVVKTVTVKYRASVRLSVVPNAPAPSWAST